jgi:hypothetical protein
MSEGELILYTTEDGAADIQLRAVNGTVWLTQRQLADLFDTTVSNINKHVKGILEDGEATEATIEYFSIVQREGDREVSRDVAHYNLDMILAVGYRVRSDRGVQFRRWATTTLREYLVKGFVMDDARLKDPKHDYFDELLERIRDIRASEARVYQRVRDVLALSEDYDPKSEAVRTFYARIQNKMLYAVAGGTAAELIKARADASAPNMGLTSWKGARVRKGDVATAKNYLGEAEVRELNLIVTMFLDTMELRAQRRQTIRLEEWDGVLDSFLKANEMPVLDGAGSLTKKQAEAIAHHAYEAFDASRKTAEREEAEALDELEELQRIAEDSKKKRGA